MVIAILFQKQNTMGKRIDFLQLHLIILLNSFIPKILIEISIPSTEIVFLRTILATILLFFYLKYKNISINLDKKVIFQLLFWGVITSLYWILLSDAAKTSNSSVTLVGMATTSLWVSLMTFFSRSKINFFQIAISILGFIGVYVIYTSNFDYTLGFSIAIIAAFVGAGLTVGNAHFAQTQNHFVVTFYLMAGATLGTGIFLPFHYHYFSESNLNFVPTLYDLALIVGLAAVYSIYLYSAFIKVMKRISAFIVALTSNMSPIYGILFSLFIYQKKEFMTLNFYIGAIIILASVFTYPLVEFMTEKR